MKLAYLLKLGLSYFYRYLRRYLFLLATMAFGFGIITLFSALLAGMGEGIEGSARGHYEGEISIRGERKEYDSNIIPNKEEVLALLAPLKADIQEVLFRTNPSISALGGAQLVFNGASVPQKYLIGIDWEGEKGAFQFLSSQDREVLEEEGLKGGILISSPVAEKLSLRRGDRVLLEGRTKTKQANTRYFIVRGIVEDRSIFGYYKSYFDREDLNTFIAYEPGDISIIGINLKPGRKRQEVSLEIQRLLAAALPTAGLIENREDLSRYRQEAWEGVRYFVLPLEAYLSDIADLFAVINWISYFIYALLLLIILVTVSVTYRVVLHEREKELATMVAIAFKRRDLVILLLIEAFFLYLWALLVGFFLMKLLAWGLSFYSFSWLPSVEIFMPRGRLEAVFRWRDLGANALILLGVLLCSVAFSGYNATRGSLAATLSGGNR